MLVASFAHTLRPHILHLIPKDKSVIIFDGLCNLCAGTVQFIIARDHEKQFLFLPAQSTRAAAVYEDMGLSRCKLETNILIVDGQAYTKAAAFIEITRRFGGVWKAMPLLYLLPACFSNWVYDRIASNRYRLFGKRQKCLVPTPDIAARFLS